MAELRELAAALGVALHNAPAGLEIARVSSIGAASIDTLVFAEDPRSAAAACASACGAVLVTDALAANCATGKPVLVSPHPRLDFARAAKLLKPGAPAPGVHPAAAIHTSALVSPSASVAAFATIAAGCSIGEGTRIGEGAAIGEGVTIGCDCRIYPRTVLYSGATLGDRVTVHAGAVLGADGFGYVRDAYTGESIQFPQQGTLVIEDDVEIGANTTIDRGALAETRIGRGTKIDNLVHIGHNCTIGRNVVIAAQTGISGSSMIGDNAVLGGQVGIGDHAAVGDGVLLGGQAGILPGKKLRGAGVLFWGTPAKPVKEYLRGLAVLARLSRPSKD